MSNETTTFILDYAEVHRDFSLGDLFAYLQEKTGIIKSSLCWYLLKLVNVIVLVRTGWGTYAKVMKEVYGLLQSDFPFAKYDIFANLTQEAEYHRNRWPTIRRNI